MRKFISLSLTLILFAAYASGCGGKNDSGSSSKKSSSSSYIAEDTTSESTEVLTAELTTTAPVTTTTAAASTTVTTASHEESTTVASSGEPSELPVVSQEPNAPLPVADEDISGKWETERYLSSGIDISEELGIPVSLIFQLELNSNGTAVAYSVVNYEDYVQTPPGTWSKNGNIVSVDIDDEVVDFELKDERLFYEDGEIIMQLIKVENFTEVDLSSLYDDMNDWED